MLTDSQRKHISKLHQKKHRSQSEQFIVEGRKGCEEALAHADVSAVVISSAVQEKFAALITDAENRNVEVLYASEKDIKSIKATTTFPGCLAVVNMPETSLEDIEGPVVCLEAINDPGNLGTIIRTADWFGVKHIILSENSVDPFNEKVVRSTMGSIFRMNIHQSEHIVTDLAWLKEKQGYQLAGLVMDGEVVHSLEGSQQTCYIFGSESHGISSELQEQLDQRYTIPGKGDAESLNVAIAAGIILSKI